MKANMSRVLFGKIVATFWGIMFILFGVCFAGNNVNKVYAASTLDTTTYTDYAFKTYTGTEAKEYVGKKVPAEEAGYVFAGWYTTATCKVEEAVKTNDSVQSSDSVTYYAKYVPEEVLSIRVQVSTKEDVNPEVDGNQRNMRVVSSVDTLNYSKVGFRLKYKEGNNEKNDWIYKKNTAEIVYERIQSATEGDEYKFSPKVVNTKSQYFMTATWKGDGNTGISEADLDTNYYIRAYWVTLDGMTVYGPTRYVSVNDGLHTNIVNMSVKNSTWIEESTLTTDAYAGASVSVAYQDGAYAHLKVDLGEGVDRAQVLKSVTKFTITDGSAEEEVIYRNLYTKYTGTGSEDTSWYGVYGTSPKEYVIATAADLYGLASLVNTPPYYFGNKIIYVVADIEVNKGRATESGWSTTTEDGTAIEGATSHVWTPIGYEGKNFQGTFDGQGHTISGLNGTPTTTVTEAYLGLFGAVGTKTLQGNLKNFRLTNSYFEERRTNTNYTGSIAGRINGNIESVYSDAYVKGYTILTGGLTGRIGVNNDETGAKQITNCWYDGTIILDGDSATYGGGFVGQQFSGTLAMLDCLFSGKIKVVNRTTAGEVNVGGFCGRAATSMTFENCLNSGEVSQDDSALSLTALGRVIGLITNSASITIESSDVYYTNVGSGSLKWYAGGNPVIKGTPVQIEEADITGMCAYYNDILVNTDAWLITKTTPQLALFGEELTVPENADIDWFTGFDEKNYKICDEETNEENVAELYGFAFLSNAGINFDEMTITLANDVTVNEGTVSEWEASEFENLTEWTPISSSETEFAGIFDGDMNSISGIYVNTSEKGVGLFGSTADGSEIKDLKLENSYFENTTTGYVGSIVGSASGNLTNVYSDAIVKVTAPASVQIGAAGGLVAEMNGTGTMDLTNCWFAGSVTNTYASTGGIVGIVAQGKVNMVNCLNTGELTGATNSVGGLCSRTFRSTEKLTMNGMAVSTLELHMTDCLNAGEILSGVNWTGSIIGRIQHLTQGMTCTDVYTTNESYMVSGVATPIGNGSLATTSAPINTVSVNNIIGLNAYYRNILVDKEAWVPTDTTPALKVFVDGISTTSSDDVNIDWFTGLDATEYIICDEVTKEANAAELKGFAYLANHGIDFAGITVTLANDVTLNEETISELTEEQRAELDAWIPIGTIDKPFAGTFDGGLYSISGLYVTSDSDALGLFAATAEESTVQNLKVLNSYFENTTSCTGSIVGLCEGSIKNVYSEAFVKGYTFTGGLIGRIYTKSTKDVDVNNCWFAGELNATYNQAGGIVGAIDGGTVKMTDCLNTADIVCSGAKSAFNGGICGGMTEETGYVVDVTMRNCLNVGKLTNCNTSESSFVGSVLGRKNGNAATTFTNVYGTNESYFKTVGGTSIPSGSTKVDERDITGVYAYYNNILVNEVAWVATETTPELELFSNTEFELPVLASDVDITWYEGIGTKTYAICDEDTNEANVAELKGLAYLTNHGIDFSGITITLANNVTLNEETISELTKEQRAELVVWTPIGTMEKPFAGIFDGGLHSISGLYATATSDGMGLFAATAKGSKVQNLKVLNSYFENTTSYTGSIIGKCAGSLENVYSKATVSGDLQVGGLVGQIYAADKEELNLINCWFAGNVISTDNNTGGIVGSINYGSVKIMDCLNSGTIKGVTSKSHIGGLIGGMVADAQGDVNVAMTNCLNTGKLTSVNTDSGSWVGAILGRKNGYAAMTFTNVYGTNESYFKDVGGTSIPGGSTMVDESMITGALAQNALTDFDFSENGKWALINGATPQLRAFADETNILAGDFSWYSADSDKYTIDTADELIGFSTLASCGTTFSGKTIKLGANINLNEGWTASANPEAPEVAWNPVGTELAPFAGTFDGQGKTISGLYVASDSAYIGLFGVTGESSEVKNLSVKNSYFEQQVNAPDDVEEIAGYVGSIVGWLNGDMTDVYSNAIVKSGNRYTGGLVSQVSSIKRTDVSKPINITNCWFDGQIITGTYGRYIGGIAAGILNGTCNMENVLFTGTIDASYNGEKAIYLGGITGEVKAIAQALNLKSVVAAGKIVGNHTGNQCNAVVGRVRIANIYNNNTVNASAANPHLDMTYVFATRDCYASTHGIDTTVYTGTKIITEAVTDEAGNVVIPAVTEEITAKVTVTGVVARTNGDDRLLGYIPNKTIESDKENPVVSSLKFTDAWSMRTDGVPIPKTLSYIVGDKISNADATALAKEIGLDYWNASAKITDAEDYGAGNYLITYTTTADLTYTKYLEKLRTLGFTKYADNTSSDMDDDGVHQAIYKKDSPEWVLNVMWVENESKIYISINTDKKSLDDNLVSAVQTEGEAISLSMLEIANGELDANGNVVDQYGNSFVFELPDGHFIVSDGGRAGDGLKLIEYLRGLVGKTDGVQNLIYIDAWIITHYHGDHCGALTIFNDYPKYRESVYVDAIYVSEPSSYAADYWEADRVAVMNNIYKGISHLTKQDNVTRPNIYQMHMGQRYYFNGITMDVLDTQEQHPVESWADNNGKLPDPFNTSSTSCVFSFADGNGATKKVFMGGDATNVNLTYMMMAYGVNNKTLANIDVFVALHHGHNTTATYGIGENSMGREYKGVANTDWADFLLTNTNNTDQKFDAVLFPYYEVYKLNWEFGQGYVDNIGSKAYPYNIGDMNRYLYEDGKATMNYTYGEGTVKLTFGTTIEANVLPSWK